MGKLNSVRDGSDIDKPMPRQRQVPTSTFGEVKKKLHLYTSISGKRR